MMGEDLAIVGLACRFPGARDVGEFWRNLCEGREASTERSDAELLAAGVPAEVLADPTYVRTSFAVDGADEFDARFFGVHVDEAQLMDPQQRLMLEVGYQALEDAAWVSRAQRCTTSVFASAGGVASSYYMQFASRFAAQPHRTTGSVAHLVNDKDFLATRLSFKLGLTGPSLSVQTACSSSLVALHLARMSLLVGESDLAVVGASCIRVPLAAGYVSGDNPVLSPVGKCKAFADDADGTVFGSGVAAVVLKRYADAVRDHDHVYALVKSTATTNDGAAKIGYTASSVPGQARAMVQAITAARISARDISYVECHGTATRIGDPLEAKSLERVFRMDTPDVQFCGIGSVKPNIGHLEQAAGLASLIKVALMLEHRKLVPSINHRRPNPKIDLEKSPFYVVQDTSDWTAPAGGPRIAAINCLGIGGTNAFAVLAEAPARDARELAGDTADPEVVCVSAKTPAQLAQYVTQLAEFLDGNPGIRTRDFCYTVNLSRSHHKVRCCALLSGELASAAALRAGLERPVAPEVILAKETLYVCNPSMVVTSLAGLESDPRLAVLRARHAELSAQLLSAQPEATDRLAALCRTLAFEVAVHAQLAAWGVVSNQVRGVGFGRVVQTAIESKDPGRVLASLGAWASASAADGASRELPDGDEGTALAAEARLSTHYTVYRCTPPVGAPPARGPALGHRGEPVTPGDLALLLARHLELGRELDWETYYRDAPASALSLPTYPFARDRHWIGE